MEEVEVTSAAATAATAATSREPGMTPEGARSLAVEDGSPVPAVDPNSTASAKKKPRGGRVNGHFIALLLAAILSPAVASLSHWSVFARYEGPAGRIAYDPVILWLFYASTQCLLIGGTLVAACLMWRGWWRSGWLIWLAWHLVILAVAEADRQTYARTNLHLRAYVPFLFTPTAVQWGGDIRLGSYFGTLLLQAARDVVLLPLATAIIVAALTTRYASPRARVRVTAALVIILAIACAGVVPAQATYANRARLVRAHASLPMDLRWLAPGVAFGNTSAFERAFNKRLGSAPARIWTDAVPRATPARPQVDDARRDVVLIIVESLRADALTPEVMPRTAAHAVNGAQFQRHASGAKFTQFGIYNLLTGRPAFSYQADLDRAGRAPAAAAGFRQLGYSTRFFSSSAYEWRGLEQFIDGGAFRVAKHHQRGSWPLSDQLAARAAREFLKSPAAEPRFVAVYLTSTHFPYKYPGQFERWTPTLSANTNIVKLSNDEGRTALVNRYRNSCGFIDDEIGAIIDGLDLTRTVVAVTGDHGESFWEDNSLTHGGRWSDIVVRVPCLLLGAGIPAGTLHAEPTLHQDVMPTLLRLATGRPVPIVGVMGRDLFAPVHDEPLVLCAETTEQYGQALLAYRGRRLLVEFPRSAGRTIVLGTVDLLGNVDPFDAPPVEEAAAWASGLRALLDRVEPPPPKPFRSGRKRGTKPKPTTQAAAVDASIAPMATVETRAASQAVSMPLGQDR